MAQINKPNQYFDTILRNGLNGTTDTSYTLNFQPDFLWDKSRSVSGVHSLFDSVRGVGVSGKVLYSHLTNAEATNGLVKSFDTNGFTIEESADNSTSVTIVDWCWKAGGTGVSNTDGSITSTVSANTTSGFSIVSYTGNGTGGSTIGHGLGVTPDFIILKSRSGVHNWYVYHKSYGVGYAKLNLTDTFSSATDVFPVAPTSSVFTIASDASINTNTHNYIAYCFAEKKGFSKFGSYTGNFNADGTFVYTGFKPAFIMIKSSSVSSDWGIWDNKRPEYNVVNLTLQQHKSNAEVVSVGRDIDILSNGFKTRGTSSSMNGSGASYIYMAFAESPLVGTNNIPATAR